MSSLKNLRTEGPRHHERKIKGSSPGGNRSGGKLRYSFARLIPHTPTERERRNRKGVVTPGANRSVFVP